MRNFKPAHIMRAIDIDHLEKYVSGDDALRDEILTIFQDQIETLRARININDEDDAWHDTMHALKGACLGVGAWETGDLCEKGQQLIKDCPNKLEARKELQAELNSRLDDMVEDARQIRNGA